MPLKVFTIGKKEEKGGIMSKSAFKILFYIRKDQVNKEGKSGIMIRLTVNGEIVQFSSNLDVVPELWDVNT